MWKTTKTESVNVKKNLPKQEYASNHMAWPSWRKAFKARELLFLAVLSLRDKTPLVKLKTSQTKYYKLFNYKHQKWVNVVFVRSKKKDPSLTELHRLNILECVQSATTVHHQQHQYNTAFIKKKKKKSSSEWKTRFCNYISVPVLNHMLKVNYINSLLVYNYAFKVQNMIWSIHPTKSTFTSFLPSLVEKYK